MPILVYPLLCSSQSELRLPLLQVVSNNKSFSVGVQSPTEINAPRGCAVILRRICQLSLTRITHQVSRAFNLNLPLKHSLLIFISVLSCRNNYDISVCAPSYNSKAHPRQSFHAKKGLDHWSSPVFLRVCATS